MSEMTSALFFQALDLDQRRERLAAQYGRHGHGTRARSAGLGRLRALLPGAAGSLGAHAHG